jgi:apolipoprotein N-acyltransferase
MLVLRPHLRSIWVGELFLPLLVVALVFNFGFRQFSHEPAAERNLRVLLVQPSIPQALIWDSDKDAERFLELLRLSEQALTNQVELLIWPESAVPKMLRYHQETFDAIAGLAKRHHVWIIVGSDDAEPRRGAGKPEEQYFNSSFLVSPEGRLLERYIKRNLVIFGEYVPLQSWLPFLKYLTPVTGGFTPGTRATPFELEDLDVRASVLICFEDVFPQLARKDITPGTDFLVNITNDGWFGESAAQWQQAATALFRAVENRVPLIRCCNNGLTCWVDEYGRLRQVFRDTRGTVYGPGFMVATVPLHPAGEPHSLTFYTRHGDWLGWACVGGALVVVGFRLRAQIRLRRVSQ